MQFDHFWTHYPILLPSSGKAKRRDGALPEDAGERFRSATQFRGLKEKEMGYTENTAPSLGPLTCLCQKTVMINKQIGNVHQGKGAHNIAKHSHAIGALLVRQKLISFDRRLFM